MTSSPPPPAPPPPTQPDLFELALTDYRTRFLARFPAIWQAILAEIAQSAPVTRLWNVYNEGYLLRGPGSAAPLLAIDLVIPKQLDPQVRQAALDGLPSLAGLLVTHQIGRAHV